MWTSWIIPMFLFRESAWVNDFAQYSHLKQNIGLKEHITAVHEKRFNCDQCGKIFARGLNLKVHIQTLHEKDFEFNCDYCGKFSPKPCI